MGHSRDSRELSEKDLEQVAGGGMQSVPKKPGNPDLPPPVLNDGGKKKDPISGGSAGGGEETPAPVGEKKFSL